MTKYYTKQWFDQGFNDDENDECENQDKLICLAQNYINEYIFILQTP